MIIAFKSHIYYGPITFPIGGEKFHLSNGKSFAIYPACAPKVEAEDGSVWEFRGTSAYACDNKERVKGWQKYSGPVTQKWSENNE